MGFVGDFRQQELELGELGGWVSGLTLSSALTSCTSPSSCSPSLWIQGRKQGKRGRAGGKRRGFGLGGDVGGG